MLKINIGGLSERSKVRNSKSTRFSVPPYAPKPHEHRVLGIGISSLFEQTLTLCSQFSKLAFLTILYGEVSERSKVVVSKTTAPSKGAKGSNPFLSANELLLVKMSCLAMAHFLLPNS